MKITMDVSNLIDIARRQEGIDSVGHASHHHILMEQIEQAVIQVARELTLIL